MELRESFFFFFLIYLIFGCVGSSFLCEGFLQLWQAGATLHRDARASRGLSCCGAQAPDAQAQQLWLKGPAAPRHAGCRMRDPPRPGFEPVCPALAGRLSATAPPGKPERKLFKTVKTLVRFNPNGKVPMERGLKWPRVVELCP